MSAFSSPPSTTTLDIQMKVDSFVERIGSECSNLGLELQEMIFDHNHDMLTFEERINVLKLKREARDLISKLKRSSLELDEKSRLIGVATDLLTVKTTIAAETEIVYDHIIECLKKLQDNIFSINEIRISLRGRLSAQSLMKLNHANKLSKITILKYQERAQELSIQVMDSKYTASHMSAIIEAVSA